MQNDSSTDPRSDSRDIRIPSCGFTRSFTIPNRNVGEDRMVASILIYLQGRGAWAIRTHAHNTSKPCIPRKGVPDIVGCYKGRALGIEVKTYSGRTSPEQEWELQAIREAGGVAFVARSTVDVGRELNSIDAHPKSDDEFWVGV